MFEVEQFAYAVEEGLCQFVHSNFAEAGTAEKQAVAFTFLFIEIIDAGKR